MDRGKESHFAVETPRHTRPLPGDQGQQREVAPSARARGVPAREQCRSSRRAPRPSLATRKPSDQPQLHTFHQNTCRVLLKTVKVTKTRESEKLSQPRGPKEPGRLKAVWSHSWDSGPAQGR